MTYTYNELGERTKRTPSIDPATTYGYNQAGRLTSVERPKEGETSEIKDNYEYNGEGLRTSQTINDTTTYLAWNKAEELPLIFTTIAAPKGEHALSVTQEGGRWRVATPIAISVVYETPSAAAGVDGPSSG